MSKGEYTSGELLAMIRAKYAPPAFAVITEVPNATGFSKSRSCDAMAFGCWKSKGLTIEGFEVKVSRSDWLREIQDRSKSSAFERHCHHWWIVASPKVAKVEEMPSNWGLMEPCGNGLKVRKAPDLRMPEPVTTAMLAAFVRRATEHAASAEQLQGAREQGYREGYAQGEKAVKRGAVANERESFKRAYELTCEALQKFETASGVKVTAYDGEHVGKAFAAFRDLRGSTQLIRDLQRVAGIASKFSAATEELMEALRVAERAVGVHE